jgi:hypothetical protein
MRKPSEVRKDEKEQQNSGDDLPQASRASASGIKAWPFAPGSQLEKQVARPWTPKPSYRFNQR